MTQSEKREQKAFLLLEHSEAKQELAHLEEKGSQTLECLQDLIKWYEHRVQFRGCNTKIDIDNPRYAAFGAENLKTVVDEIETAREKIKVLGERLTKLGL